jgi:hypothetical protein
VGADVPGVGADAPGVGAVQYALGVDNCEEVEMRIPGEVGSMMSSAH